MKTVWVSVITSVFNFVFAFDRDCSKLTNLESCDECIRCDGSWCKDPNELTRCTIDVKDKWCTADQETRTTYSPERIIGNFFDFKVQSQTLFSGINSELSVIFPVDYKDSQKNILPISAKQNVSYTHQTICDDECTFTITPYIDKNFCSPNAKADETFGFKVDVDGIDEVAELNYFVPCVCQCSAKIDQKSTACNGNGNYSCGSCACYEDWDGKFCEKRKPLAPIVGDRIYLPTTVKDTRLQSSTKSAVTINNKDRVTITTDDKYILSTTADDTHLQHSTVEGTVNDTQLPLPTTKKYMNQETTTEYGADLLAQTTVDSKSQEILEVDYSYHLPTTDNDTRLQALTTIDNKNGITTSVYDNNQLQTTEDDTHVHAQITIDNKNEVTTTIDDNNQLETTGDDTHLKALTTIDNIIQITTPLDDSYSLTTATDDMTNEMTAPVDNNNRIPTTEDDMHPQEPTTIDNKYEITTPVDDNNQSLTIEDDTRLQAPTTINNKNEITTPVDVNNQLVATRDDTHLQVPTTIDNMNQITTPLEDSYPLPTTTDDIELQSTTAVNNKSTVDDKSYQFQGKNGSSDYNDDDLCVTLEKCKECFFVPTPGRCQHCSLNVYLDTYNESFEINKTVEYMWVRCNITSHNCTKVYVARKTKSENVFYTIIKSCELNAKPSIGVFYCSGLAACLVVLAFVTPIFISYIYYKNRISSKLLNKPTYVTAEDFTETMTINILYKSPISHFKNPIFEGKQ